MPEVSHSDAIETHLGKLKPPPLWALHRNPIIVMCARARLRPKKIAMRLALTLIVTGFFFSMVFFELTMQEERTVAQAASATLIPIIIIQSAILLLLGTNSVAAGIAAERQSETIDDHRLSPLSIPHKVIGFALGLPIREYAMLLVTVPFAIFAIVMGETPLTTVLQFYLVLFTTTLLYHLTGLVSGLSSKKTRGIGFGSSALVLILMVFVPRLSMAGFSVLQFVTVWPVFVGLISQEVLSAPADPNATVFRPDDAGEWNPVPISETNLEEIQPGQWAEVPFFNVEIHAVAFSTLLQGLLIGAMLLVAIRKWSATPHHALPKSYTLAMYLGIQTLLIGSVWPLFTRNQRYILPMEVFNGNRYTEPPGEPTMNDFALISMFYLITSLGCVWALTSINSANDPNYRYGLRRMFKLGRKRMGLDEDAASCLPLCLGLLLVTWLGYAALWWSALYGPFVFTETPPLWPMVAPMILLTATILMIQGLGEYRGGKIVGPALLVIWILPLLAAIVLVTATRDGHLPSLLAGPFAPIGIVFSVIWQVNQLFDYAANVSSNWQDFEREGTLPQSLLLGINVTTYVGLAIVAQTMRRRYRRRAATEEGQDLAARLGRTKTPLSPADDAANDHLDQPEIKSVS